VFANPSLVGRIRQQRDHFESPLFLNPHYFKCNAVHAFYKQGLNARSWTLSPAAALALIDAEFTAHAAVLDEIPPLAAAADRLRCALAVTEIAPVPHARDDAGCSARPLEMYSVTTDSGGDIASAKELFLADIDDNPDKLAFCGPCFAHQYHLTVLMKLLAIDQLLLPAFGINCGTGSPKWSYVE
jgi:hypothetical protein